MNSTLHFTVFHAGRRLCAGTLCEIAQVLIGFDAGFDPVLVFDDATGGQVDAPVSPSTPGRPTTGCPDILPPDPAPPPAVGRPRLGVVAREVTLLPRHWEWLAEQPGGASAALRRLVDEARRSGAGSHARRLAKERTYRCMSAIAGQLPGFEEAARALFGQGASAATAFRQCAETWPPDIRAYLATLSRGAFDIDPRDS